VVGVEVPMDVGRVDILARDKEGRYVVIEVKRDVATHEAVFQLARYVEIYKKIVKINPRELTGLSVAT